MSRRTKKTGSAARFGSRYGYTLKKKFAVAERQRKRKYPCEQCGKIGVRRHAAGIWKCRYCGRTFVGGAYVPRTDVSAITYGKGERNV